ncbi:MAG: KamA family radical SAM protein [Spirochaetales bacterium]|nr:KamA family radical SAM protein [Spirochaetales bacterium]
MRDIPDSIRLTENEKAWFAASQETLTFKSNPYYMDLARQSEAVRHQLIPTVSELDYREYESRDPLSEELFSPLPRMVHRYRNRVALLLTDNCSIHCRHCFRRSFTGTGNNNLSLEDCDRVIGYLNEHPEVKEVLLTGGDPLTLPLSHLAAILDRFRNRAENTKLILRMATRIPAVLPAGITGELLHVLRKSSPLWMVIQFNHPDELTAESREALQKIREAGIPAVNQTVLLKGINDDPQVLGELFQELLAEGVKPYYLFQGDLARGTSHFRVSLERGWQIMDELRQIVSGLAMPTYAVDLPGGGGKIPLSRSLLIRESETGYIFRNREDSNREFEYPRESDS